MHPFLTPEFACHRERDVRREVAATRGRRLERVVAALCDCRGR